MILIFIFAIDVSAAVIFSSCNKLFYIGTGPCIAVSQPKGGVGEVSADTERYRIEIMVHRRKNNPKVKLWWSKQQDQTWNVLINWFRLLETKVRIPLTACRFVYCSQKRSRTLGFLQKKPNFIKGQNCASFSTGRIHSISFPNSRGLEHTLSKINTLFLEVTNRLADFCTADPFLKTNL